MPRNEIEVEGRGIKRAVVAVRPDADGLMVMVDDADRPEFWLHLFIPGDKLDQLAATVRRAAELYITGTLPDSPETVPTANSPPNGRK